MRGGGALIVPRDVSGCKSRVVGVNGKLMDKRSPVRYGTYTLRARRNLAITQGKLHLSGSISALRVSDPPTPSPEPGLASYRYCLHLLPLFH